MIYSLDNIKRPSGNKRRKKRVGRGNASGKGTFAGRGLKGQRARSGGRQGIKKRAAFQQLFIRTPKSRGFNRESPEIATINLSVLGENFKEGEVVNSKFLIERGLIRKTRGGYKVLAHGKIGKKLEVTANYFSTAAKKAIKEAGGKWILIPRKPKNGEKSKVKSAK